MATVLSSSSTSLSPSPPLSIAFRECLPTHRILVQMILYKRWCCLLVSQHRFLCLLQMPFGAFSLFAHLTSLGQDLLFAFARLKYSPTTCSQQPTSPSAILTRPRPY